MNIGGRTQPLIWLIWPIKCFPHLKTHTQQNHNSLVGSVLLWRHSGRYLLLQHALRGLHNLPHTGKYCFLYIIFSYFKSSYGIIGIAAPPPSPPASSSVLSLGWGRAGSGRPGVWPVQSMWRDQGTLYKRQGHIVRSTTQQKKLDLGEIDLTWPLHFPSASALEQDLGITDLDIVRGWIASP